MQVRFKISDIKEILTTLPNSKDKVVIHNDGMFEIGDQYLGSLLDGFSRYGGDVTINLNRVDPAILNDLYEYVKENRKDYNNHLQIIGRYIKLKKNPSAPVKQLKGLDAALTLYLQQNTYEVFVMKDMNKGKKDHEIPLLYYVKDIKYNPADTRAGTEANVTIQLLYNGRGKLCKTYESIGTSELIDLKSSGNNTAEGILASMGLYVITEEQYEEYTAQFNRWVQFLLPDNMGAQYTIVRDCDGEVINEDGSRSWYRAHSLTLSNDIRTVKLVADEYKKLDAINIVSSTSVLLAEDNTRTIRLPVHPLVRVFDLYSHEFLYLHIDYLEKYVYDSTMIDKLILPDDTKNFIDMLLGGVDDIKQEIVKDKTGGIITMLSGHPGVGKTLTAEVYSELIEKPLYKVQSTQLGISVDKIEKNLAEILDRASRWKAVLMLDECEVYIRQRSNDLVQNAIVGVFLRVLEYYPGILFMATNRPEDIDEAIMSRCIAHLRYGYPTAEHAKLITNIMLDLYVGVEATIQHHEYYKKFVGEFVGKYGKSGQLSGRNIKNIIKLAAMMAKRRNSDRITMDVVEYVYNFNSVT